MDGSWHVYGCRYRPPGYATVPDGWRAVERERWGEFTHGLVAYARGIEAQELEAFQLEPVAILDRPVPDRPLSLQLSGD